MAEAEEVTIYTEVEEEDNIGKTEEVSIITKVEDMAMVEEEVTGPPEILVSDPKTFLHGTPTMNQMMILSDQVTCLGTHHRTR